MKNYIGKCNAYCKVIRASLGAYLVAENDRSKHMNLKFHKRLRLASKGIFDNDIL